MTNENGSLIDRVNAKTKLAGTNKIELLLFSLGKNPATGREEHYGINVFKVREVIRRPDITAAPGSPEGVVGMVSLRGEITPVMDIARCMGLNIDETQQSIMIVTEYNGHTQGFLVDAVDTIIRLDWGDMREPPMMLSNGSSVTSICELKDGRLIQVLDVESVLAKYVGSEYLKVGRDTVIINMLDNKKVFFCDDSPLARKQLEQFLGGIGVSYDSATNGEAAWERLDRMAQSALSEGKRLSDYYQIVITDIEMPGMDGFTLTKKIKEDDRMTGVKVLMHSSISGKSNIDLGASVGVDGYITKFNVEALKAAIHNLLGSGDQKLLAA